VAEGSAIVISILLAFSIDTGWDRLKEADEEQRILAGLEQEFEGYVRRFDFNVRAGERSLQRLETLLRAGPPAYETPPPVAAADLAFFALLSSATTDQGGNLEALLSSGRLELLRDEALRARLAAWPATMSDIRDNELSTRDWSNIVVSPFMIQHGVPIARAYEARNPDWPTEVMSDGEASRLYAQLFRDPGFAALVSQAYSFRRNHVGESREAATAAREIVQAIRSNREEN
jgi:hypothetical protein